MKLTNISLAVLVALGLVACGGSDDNKNQTTDPKPPKEIPGDGGNGGNGGADPKGDSGLVPERKAPDLSLPSDMKDLVSPRKRIFINRSFADPALGYDKNGNYVKSNGTDPADIKYQSTYNFVKEGDLITALPDGSGAINNYPLTAVGAISIGQNPEAVQNNAYALGEDGKYYRVISTKPKGQYTSKTPFKVVDATQLPATEDRNNFGAGADNIPQSKVVFIANTWSGYGLTGSKIKDASVIDLGNDNDTTHYLLGTGTKQSQVTLNGVDVFGKEYDAKTLGQNLDFNDLPHMRDIQTSDVTGKYQITNNKFTNTADDDTQISRSVKLGTIKAYNLPYSIATVTTNADSTGEKDIFGVGAFQVLGFETIALPKDGRAFYTGKSFNAKNTGDVKLIADFFEDRAGVSGSVFNRKDKDGNALPDLALLNIDLVDTKANVGHNTAGLGSVTGDRAYATDWTVQFYGQEAVEAAGAIGKFDANTNTLTPVEVYNTQRGKLTNLSNTSDVK